VAAVVLLAVASIGTSSISERLVSGNWDEINDRKIRTLKDAADAFADKPEFYVIKFVGYARPLVLERSAVEAARERIRKRYNVLAEQNVLTNEATSASR